MYGSSAKLNDVMPVYGNSFGELSCGHTFCSQFQQQPQELRQFNRCDLNGDRHPGMEIL